MSYGYLYNIPTSIVFLFLAFLVYIINIENNLISYF